MLGSRPIRAEILRRACSRPELWDLDQLEAFLRWLEVPKGQSVLDVGCGAGFLGLLLASSNDELQLRGVDPDESALKKARSLAAELGLEASFESGAAHSLPGAEGELDVVACCALLINIRRPALALNEMVRVARHAVVVVEPLRPEGCPSALIPPNTSDELQVLAERFRRARVEGERRAGLEPDLPRRLPALMRAAGLESLVERVFQHSESTATLADAELRALAARCAGYIRAHEAGEIDQAERRALEGGLNPDALKAYVRLSMEAMRGVISRPESLREKPTVRIRQLLAVRGDVA